MGLEALNVPQPVTIKNEKKSERSLKIRASGEWFAEEEKPQRCLSLVKQYVLLTSVRETTH
jgi:hypothetical protein